MKTKTFDLPQFHQRVVSIRAGLLKFFCSATHFEKVYAAPR